MSLPWGLGPREVAIALADVAIVAFVLYRTLRFLRGTRALQMAAGLAALGLVFVAARRLEMQTLSWLLEHFLDYSILLIIVVFQGDIRRGLTRLGRRLFRREAYVEERHVIAEVVRAAGELAARRMGALIVIEREADVGDFVHGGVTIDAPVRAELLRSLFTPSANNPLHDGAVVIRQLRVFQARAILPLSRSRVERGTRHRAALGLCEDTDAVVVIVSEERGSIGLAVGGRVTVDLDVAGLRAALERALGGVAGVAS